MLFFLSVLQANSVYLYHMNEVPPSSSNRPSRVRTKTPTDMYPNVKIERYIRTSSLTENISERQGNSQYIRTSGPTCPDARSDLSGRSEESPTVQRLCRPVGVLHAAPLVILELAEFLQLWKN